jgi:hypothetical protein
LGRVVFTKEGEAALDWSEIESRLQDISAVSPPSHLSSDTQPDPAANLTSDPLAANDFLSLTAKSEFFDDGISIQLILTSPNASIVSDRIETPCIQNKQIGRFVAGASRAPI